MLVGQTGSKFKTADESIHEKNQNKTCGREKESFCVCFVISCIYLFCGAFALLIIIIRYIDRVLINVLSADIVHINLRMIFYTHVKHGPIKKRFT